MYGRLIPSSTFDPDIFEAMVSPVRCTHCGQVYDMSTVTITTRTPTAPVDLTLLQAHR
jgi:predicted Zn-ribbon and HTH transcriptional regulator